MDCMCVLTKTTIFQTDMGQKSESDFFWPLRSGSNSTFKFPSRRVALKGLCFKQFKQSARIPSRSIQNRGVRRKDQAARLDLRSFPSSLCICVRCLEEHSTAQPSTRVCVGLCQCPAPLLLASPRLVRSLRTSARGAAFRIECACYRHDQALHLHFFFPSTSFAFFRCRFFDRTFSIWYV